MVKKEKLKKRNASGIALNTPTRRAESCADIYTFTKKIKRAIHRPVCFSRIWKNTTKQAKGAFEEAAVSDISD